MCAGNACRWIRRQNERLAALLAEAGLGNRAAFADLYEATKSKLFAVSLRIVRERHIAEEVLQDSFVNIWNNATKYAVAQSAPMTWMTAIVRNRSLDIVRRPFLEIQDEEDFYAIMRKISMRSTWKTNVPDLMSSSRPVETK